MKNYIRSMYVNLRRMHVIAEVLLTIAGFLKGFAVFLDVHVELCSNAELCGLELEEIKVVLYLTI